MSSNNPFNFIDPLLLQFPANKMMICPKTVTKKRETFFNSKKAIKKQNWGYDNYFFREDTFSIKRRRDDRLNIEEYMKSIHDEEMKKKIPSCSQSWYGHRPSNYLEKLRPFAKIDGDKKMYYKNGLPWVNNQTSHR